MNLYLDPNIHLGNEVTLGSYQVETLGRGAKLLAPSWNPSLSDVAAKGHCTWEHRVKGTTMQEEVHILEIGSGPAASACQLKTEYSVSYICIIRSVQYLSVRVPVSQPKLFL